MSSNIFGGLPEPQKEILTKEQKSTKSYQFAVALNAFVLVYNLAHKFIMPMIVSITLHHGVGWVKLLDWWWAYHAVLALCLRRKNWDDGVLRTVMFFGLGGVASELIFSLNEYSWRVMSFWLTSLATLAVLIYIASISKFKVGAKNLKYAVPGVLLGVALQAVLLTYFTPENYVLYKAQSRRVDTSKIPVLDDSHRCGWSEFIVPVDGGNTKVPDLDQKNEIQVAPCGFPLAMAYYDPTQPLKFYNDTLSYLNIKIVAREGSLWRNTKNIPLVTHTDHVIPPTEFGHDVAIVFSDSTPGLGIMVLVKKGLVVNDALKSLVDEGALLKAKKMVFDRNGAILAE